MSQHTELIAMLREIENSWSQSDDVCKTAKEAADALQAMEFALDATATPKSLTTKREKVILLTGAQNENSLLRAQLATQSLRLEDANGLLRYVADQRDAALGKLQALERVPMTCQSIDTAPKDGTAVLLCFPGLGWVRGSWDSQIHHKKPKPYWTHDCIHYMSVAHARANQPNWWMPLPTPPESNDVLHTE